MPQLFEFVPAEKLLFPACVISARLDFLVISNVTAANYSWVVVPIMAFGADIYFIFVVSVENVIVRVTPGYFKLDDSLIVH